jgi:hypothetical protein
MEVFAIWFEKHPYKISNLVMYQMLASLGFAKCYINESLFLA